MANSGPKDAFVDLRKVRNSNLIWRDRSKFFLDFHSYVVADNLAFDEVYLKLIDEAYEVVDFFISVALFLQHS